MFNNNFIKIVIVILSFFILVTLLLYILNFSGHVLSTDPSDWGVFGDYFGGILNPITAILNIAVVIYLTYIISKTDDNNHLRNLEHQKNLTLSELKQSAYNELANKLDSLYTSLLGNTDNLKYEPVLLLTYVNSFFQNMTHLFPSLNDKENTKHILLCLTEISETIDLIDKDKENTNQHTVQLIELIKKYYKAKFALMRKLQVEMLK